MPFQKQKRGRKVVKIVNKKLNDKKKLKNKEYKCKCNKVFIPKKLYLFSNDINDINFKDFEKHDLGKMQCKCKYCDAKKWLSESIKCCNSGKVNLPSLKCPRKLKQLFYTQKAEAKFFRKYIQQINAAFAMTSMRCDAVEHIQNGDRTTPPVYTVQGNICHRMGTLYNNDKFSKPQNLQVYFYDHENQMDMRRKMNGLDHESVDMDLCNKVLETVTEVLEENNRLVQLFQFGERTIKKYKDDGQYNNIELGLRIYENVFVKGYHKKCFDPPPLSAKHLGGLICDVQNIQQNKKDRAIIIKQKNSKLSSINTRSGIYDPLQYVLFYPTGKFGWYKGVTKNKVSIRGYYNYYLHIREKDFNILHRGKKLFQQFVIDMWIKAEENNLNFNRTNQSRFRYASRKHLIDVLESDDLNLDSIGTQATHLSSTFIGGKRYKNHCFMDGVAICDKFGKPDYFITFTCNANWKEIQDELFPDQHPVDRPDLMERVFMQKFIELRNDFKERHVFGEFQAYTANIEWQKRGLPHSHILLWVKPKWKPRNPTDYDNVISAEIPDPNKQPELFKKVTKFMIHGPCNPKEKRIIFNKNKKQKEEIASWACCRNKHERCAAGFPKAFCKYTKSNEDGFPYYKRRSLEDGGFSFNKSIRHGSIDNRWVVPYNPFLLMKYDAHINVEVCNSIMATKYIFKYTNKPPDYASIAVLDELKKDEIKYYSMCRYIGPCEAVHRLFSWPIKYVYPKVERLEVHLPEQDRIKYDANNIRSTINKVYNCKRTTLTEYFNNNLLEKKLIQKGLLKRYINDKTGEKLPFGFELTYTQYPEYYTWDNHKKQWNRFKDKTIYKCSINIGRMYRVHPAEGERFYLSLLLHYIKGATSFKSLKTVNDIEYPYFRYAAYHAGLLVPDNLYERQMDDAIQYMTSDSSLISLFATILHFNDPFNGYELWLKYRDYLCAGFLHKKRCALNNFKLSYTNVEYDKGLLLLERYLLQWNKTLLDYNLPEPERIQVQSENPLIQLEYRYNRNEQSEICNKLSKCFNHKQNDIYKAIINSLYNDDQKDEQKNDDQKDEQKNCIEESYIEENCIKGKNFIFINAHGGTGKTYVSKALCANVRSRGDIAIVVATSGIASTLLPGGTTAHSRFGIPVPCYSDSSSNINKNSNAAELLKISKIVIWDEAVMANKCIIECVDRLLRDIMGVDLPFGGKMMILCGDFRQILPIVQHGSEDQIIDTCIKNSYLWEHVFEFTLIENERVKRNNTSSKKAVQEFSELLLEIGDGRLQTYDTLGENKIKVPDNMVSKSENINQFVEEIYDDLENNYKKKDYLSGRCILTPFNKHCELINNICLSKIPGEEKVYSSWDYTKYEEKRLSYSMKTLNNCKDNSLPAHKIKLKVGIPIILIRNINQRRGECNGTRCVVTKLLDHIIQAQILEGDYKGKFILIPRIKCTSNLSKKVLPFQLIRLQFPIKLCFSITINKAQGQTLNNVGLYLPEPVFSHGQLYVACSRVTKASDLSILTENTKYQGHFDGYEGVFIDNIVYKNIFY